MRLHGHGVVLQDLIVDQLSDLVHGHLGRVGPITVDVEHMAILAINHVLGTGERHPRDMAGWLPVLDPIPRHAASSSRIHTHLPTVELEAQLADRLCKGLPMKGGKVRWEAIGIRSLHCRSCGRKQGKQNVSQDFIPGSWVQNAPCA